MSGPPTLELRPPRLRRPPPAPQPVALPVDRRPTREYPCVEPHPAPPTARLLFGEWLVQHKVLTREQLLRALSVSHLHDWRIGDAAVVLGHAPRPLVEAEAERFLSDQRPREPRSHLLERRARRLELEARIRRQAAARQE